jgi:acyl-[acyl-carrier-protein]-phospholipid O-acyltransferase / long-chain-fatty-acid--[acyl-carrier-protein] ligase
MSAPQWSLLGKRRFWPLFVTQFLGAFNDNLYRSSMIFLVSFSLLKGQGDRAAMIGVLSGAVFTLPFFLFSSLAGQLADRIDKARLARLVKLAEVLIMLVGVAALDSGSLALLMLVVFAMGTHSTVFGPIKYSMLPQHLHADELMGGTGLIEAATFLAILAGQLLGGLLMPTAVIGAEHHVTAGEVMLGVAVLGLASSFFIPSAPAPASRPALEANLIRSTGRIVGHARRNRDLFLAILGITWFFSLGAVLTQQFVPLVGELNGTPAVGALFVGLFSVGVAAGSLLVGRLLGGQISARYVPVSALVVALGVIDLGLTTHGLKPAPAPADIAAFFQLPGSWRLTVAASMSCRSTRCCRRWAMPRTDRATSPPTTSSTPPAWC